MQSRPAGDRAQRILNASSRNIQQEFGRGDFFEFREQIRLAGFQEARHIDIFQELADIRAGEGQVQHILAVTGWRGHLRPTTL